MKVSGYTSRWAFILKRCEGRSVLHLGCVGETDLSSEEKVQTFSAKRVLHPHLMAIAREVLGIELDDRGVELLRDKLGVSGIVVGDAEHLVGLVPERQFEVILCCDLLEHLSCLGLALDGLRRFMGPASEIIVSVPNSVGLLANLRFTLGRFRARAQHVGSFSKFNLVTLLQRHGFQVTELYTAYDRPPWLLEAASPVYAGHSFS